MNLRLPHGSRLARVVLPAPEIVETTAEVVNETQERPNLGLARAAVAKPVQLARAVAAYARAQTGQGFAVGHFLRVQA